MRSRSTEPRRSGRRDAADRLRVRLDTMDPALASTPVLAAAVRHVRQLLNFPNGPGRPARSSYPRSPIRCRAVRRTARPTRSRSGPVFASPRPRSAGHRADVQVHDRAHAEPPHRQLCGTLLRRHRRRRRVHGGQGHPHLRHRSSGNKLIIHLRAPAPDFLARIACPRSAPFRPTRRSTPAASRTIPSAGPYYVASTPRVKGSCSAQSQLPWQAPSSLRADRARGRGPGWPRGERNRSR